MSESRFTFQQDVDLDAMLFFAASHEDTDKFRAIATSAGISDPVEGIARGYWLRDQPQEYQHKVLHRFMEIAQQAQVVS